MLLWKCWEEIQKNQYFLFVFLWCLCFLFVESRIYIPNSRICTPKLSNKSFSPAISSEFVLLNCNSKLIFQSQRFLFVSKRSKFSFASQYGWSLSCSAISLQADFLSNPVQRKYIPMSNTHNPLKAAKETEVQQFGGLEGSKACKTFF